ncbi:hypothetical protein PaeCFBP13512_02835 [Paenibacillus sp. CFBP13512]|uniref:hypothetical protein n=1 Tax=Paenibacillus sp. CFBP13512 TaxID=2184007 RepID=UPI0010BFD18B|nr:hypothetical protein [Paenibacillus sp. CFBP13512]TKJ93350.1 hypothetical protein PaeCFBP13512_02835 [Paenibacillus sp. CFBP13512]
MTIIKLPVQETLLDTYNIYGSISSVVSYNKNSLPWFYNNFIQIRYVYDWNTFFFDNHHLLIDNCPWLNHYIIPRFFIESKWESITDFIIDSLKSHNYVYMYVDRYFISSSKVYLKHSYWHEIFIYGFDSENRKFLVADNLSDGKYVHIECTFDEILKGYNAISSDNQFFLNVHLLSQKEETEYAVNIHQIILSLKNYLNSTITIDVSFKEKTIFGQEAILFSIDNTINNKTNLLDQRAFCLFYEHKKLMLNRIEFLISEEQSKLESVLECYKDIVKKFEIIKNMVLKYNKKIDYFFLLRIRKHIIEGLREEKKILEEMIRIIS